MWETATTLFRGLKAGVPGSGMGGLGVISVRVAFSSILQIHHMTWTMDTAHLVSTQENGPLWGRDL